MEYFIGKDDDGNYFLISKVKNKKKFKKTPVMNQYEWQEETEEQIISLYGKYGVTSKPDRFEAVLKHFSSKINLEREILYSEWEIYVAKKATLDPKICICSQIIRDLRFIQNKINGNILMVGNCCIEKLAKNTKLGEQNIDLNNFCDRVIRECEVCKLTCFALRMRGNYCEDCYWDLEREKRIEIDNGKRCCSHCFNMKPPFSCTGVCENCDKNGKDPIKFIFLGDAYEEVKENKIIPIKIADSKKSISESEDSEDLVVVKKPARILDDSSDDASINKSPQITRHNDSDVPFRKYSKKVSKSSTPIKSSSKEKILDSDSEDFVAAPDKKHQKVVSVSSALTKQLSPKIQDDSSEEDAPKKEKLSRSKSYSSGERWEPTNSSIRNTTEISSNRRSANIPKHCEICNIKYMVTEGEAKWWNQCRKCYKIGKIEKKCSCGKTFFVESKNKWFPHCLSCYKKYH